MFNTILRNFGCPCLSLLQMAARAAGGLLMPGVGQEDRVGRKWEKGRIVLACAVAHSDLIPTLQLSLSSTLFSHLLAGKLVTSLNQFYHGANESQLLNGGCIL